MGRRRRELRRPQVGQLRLHRRRRIEEFDEQRSLWPIRRIVSGVHALRSGIGGQTGLCPIGIRGTGVRPVWLVIVHRFAGQVLRAPVVECNRLGDQKRGPLAAPNRMLRRAVGMPARSCKRVCIVGERDHDVVVIAVGDDIHCPLGKKSGDVVAGCGRVRLAQVVQNGARVRQRQGEDVEVPRVELPCGQGIVHRRCLDVCAGNRRILGKRAAVWRVIECDRRGTAGRGVSVLLRGFVN